MRTLLFFLLLRLSQTHTRFASLCSAPPFLFCLNFYANFLCSQLESFSAVKVAFPLTRFLSPSLGAFKCKTFKKSWVNKGISFVERWVSYSQFRSSSSSIFFLDNFINSPNISGEIVFHKSWESRRSHNHRSVDSTSGGWQSQETLWDLPKDAWWSVASGDREVTTSGGSFYCEASSACPGWWGGTVDFLWECGYHRVPGLVGSAYP